MTYQCATCGKTHEEWPPDRAFSRPDEIWAMAPDERARRSDESDDLCSIDRERFFLRGVLSIPVHGLADPWGLGLWVEVAKTDFKRYWDLFDADATQEPPFPGIVANDFHGFGGTLGARVDVKLGNATKRPAFTVAEADSDLARAQREGIDVRRLHELLGE